MTSMTKAQKFARDNEGRKVFLEDEDGKVHEGTVLNRVGMGASIACHFPTLPALSSLPGWIWQPEWDGNFLRWLSPEFISANSAT